MLEETEENKKMFNIVMFDSQESIVNRLQGSKKRKKEHSIFFKNVYSTVHTLLYLTVHGL